MNLLLQKNGFNVIFHN